MTGLDVRIEHMFTYRCMLNTCYEHTFIHIYVRHVSRTHFHMQQLMLIMLSIQINFCFHRSPHSVCFFIATRYLFGALCAHGQHIGDLICCWWRNKKSQYVVKDSPISGQDHEIIPNEALHVSLLLHMAYFRIVLQKGRDISRLPKILSNPRGIGESASCYLHSKPAVCIQFLHKLVTYIMCLLMIIHWSDDY